MAGTTGRQAAADLEQVRRRIEHWRQSRDKRGRMPTPLWTAAVALAKTHGLYATARELHVDYGTLKWRLERSLAKQRPAKPVPPPTFVEIGGAMPFGPSAAGTSVELTRRDGAKLVVRCGVGEALDVAAMVKELWGQRA